MTKEEVECFVRLKHLPVKVSHEYLRLLPEPALEILHRKANVQISNMVDSHAAMIHDIIFQFHNISLFSSIDIANRHLEQLVVESYVEYYINNDK